MGTQIAPLTISATGDFVQSVLRKNSRDRACATALIVAACSSIPIDQVSDNVREQSLRRRKRPSPRFRSGAHICTRQVGKGHAVRYSRRRLPPFTVDSLLLRWQSCGESRSPALVTSVELGPRDEPICLSLVWRAEP